jgi:hypothetical protein
MGRKPAILTIMKEYSDSYVPKPKQLPMKLSVLKDNDSLYMNYMDLVQTIVPIWPSVPLWKK